MKYRDMTQSELKSELATLKEQYENYKKLGLSLDMSRGKPSPEQLDLCDGMLSILKTSADCIEGSIDTRNYGAADGIPSLAGMFSELFGVPEKNIIIGGSSSLRLMFDAIARCMLFGVGGGFAPWSAQGKIKFLCPVPGYDRHFKLCETFGIEMINVPMTPEGPDMDVVESLVANDSSIKGIWCVPKYSNPTGITCSSQTVKRLASLHCAAGDFRIFWDNAYGVHDIYDTGDTLDDILTEAEKAGNPDIVYEFASFAKISYAGGCVSMFASSDANVAFAKKYLSAQTICCDKVNQLRHVRFFKDAQGVRDHLKKHAAILRPKFETVLSTFERELTPCGIGSWTNPRGGYFISLDLPAGTAARTYSLSKDAGVTLTPVGSSFPYHRDVSDSNLRIAPSFPSVDSLAKAAAILCCCAKIASVEKLLG